MKHNELSVTLVIFLVIAIVLIFLGVTFGVSTFVRLEHLAEIYSSQEQFMDAVREAAFHAMAFGALGVLGIGILIVLFLHVFRKNNRIQREAYALREKNEMMEELNRQTQTLAHHQRLQMLGTLTSSIAHEFNNLLTPIMGYSLMALEKLSPEQEELYDNILEVYNASLSAKTLISRLSDLSRKNSDATFRVVSADELIQKTLAVAAPAKPKHVELRLDLNCLEQRILANDIQISQLLLNLILNAFQAIESDDGTLTIKTSFDEEMVFIRISDTGCGIPEENLDRIFDPFFTTKEQGRGTGLGLAIAAQVIQDHNGLIRVESKVGKGSVFTVCLPRSR